MPGDVPVLSSTGAASRQHIVASMDHTITTLFTETEVIEKMKI